jgi:hypothetical protein
MEWPVVLAGPASDSYQGTAFRRAVENKMIDVRAHGAQLHES